MDRRTAIRALIGLFIVVGAIAIGVAAYDAGYGAGVAAAASGTDGRVLPAYPYYGPFGFHGGFGFGFLGFLFPILFFVIVFVLLRAAFWGGPRRYGPWRYDRWSGGDPEFEAWHRQAHGERPETTGSGQTATPGGRTGTAI